MSSIDQYFNIIVDQYLLDKCYLALHEVFIKPFFDVHILTVKLDRRVQLIDILYVLTLKVTQKQICWVLVVSCHIVHIYVPGRVCNCAQDLVKRIVEIVPTLIYELVGRIQ